MPSACATTPDCADAELRAGASALDDPESCRSWRSIGRGRRRALRSIRAPAARGRAARQGVNSEVEMAAAFTRAGFEAVDVTMSDLLTGRHALNSSPGWRACGGFSLRRRAGRRARLGTSILFHARLRGTSRQFFADPAGFALGACNGCQMLAGLRGHHSRCGALATLPRRNQSERYEARLVTVEAMESPSIFPRHGRIAPPGRHRHGEGPRGARPARRRAARWRPCLRFVDNYGNRPRPSRSIPTVRPAVDRLHRRRWPRASILMPIPSACSAACS